VVERKKVEQEVVEKKKRGRAGTGTSGSKYERPDS
jgi:hypothetical protein